MDDPAIVEAQEKLRQAEEDLQRAYKRLEAAFVAHQNAFGEYEPEFGELPPVYVDSGNPKTARIDAALLACRQAEQDRDDARHRINEAKRFLGSVSE
jgi:hypothetical protein